jgi:hypothetical protein
MNCVRCELAMPTGTTFCPDCAMIASLALADTAQLPGSPLAGGSAAIELGQHRPHGVNLRRLRPAEQIVALASLALVAALFLPWFSVPGIGTGTSASGLTAHGYLALALVTGLGLPGYLLVRAARAKQPGRPHAPLLLAGTGLQLILIVGAFITRPGAATWGPGALLALAAALTACAVTIGPVLRAAQPPC